MTKVALSSINSRGPTGDITNGHQPEAPLGRNVARANRRSNKCAREDRVVFCLIYFYSRHKFCPDKVKMARMGL